MENQATTLMDTMSATATNPINILLKNWGLEHLSNKFHEEGITLDILKDFIEEKHILESLVPRIGDRLRLLQKAKDYFGAGKQSEYTVIYDQETSIEENLINEDLILLSPSVSVSTISTPATSTSFDLLTEPPPRKKSNDLNNFITNFDLKEILESSALGKALLSWYCIKGALDTARQGYLVDIITTETINRGFTHLTNNDYNILSQKIVEVFPSEVTEVYYLAPVKKKDSLINKPGLAKGKLVDKFRNRLTFLREARLLPSRTSTGVLSSTIKEAEEEHVQDQSLEKHIQWLYHNREPLEEVYKHWDSSFASRRQKLLKEGGDLTEFYKEYPILKESICLSLIERDFDKIFATKKSLFLTWEPTITKLITLRRQYVTSDTDKVLLDLLQSSCLENDYRIFLMFSLLPTLLPNRSRHVYGRSRKQWKPTTSDSRNGIILRVDLPGDIEHALELRKEKLKGFDIAFQPFIVVHCNGTTVHNVYLYVNDQLYKVGSVLKAIDLCFKCYHSFHLKYQTESEHIWFFIQRALYDIKSKWDTAIPNILDLVNKTKTE